MDALFGPHWQPEVPDTSEPLHGWLTSQGSLTAKVKAACREDFSVRVLCHEIVAASGPAADALQLAPAASVLYREVLLLDGDSPCVFAASILPLSALTGRFAPLRELGARPLGHWIFSEPQLQRTQMRFAQLPRQHSLFTRVPDTATLLPLLAGRKTHFSGAEKDFLVSEFFLF